MLTGIQYDEASMRLLRAIVDSAPVRIFWKDRDSRYLGCNAHFARDAGCESPEAIIGRTDHDLLPREAADAYRANDLAIMNSGVARLDYPETVPAAQGPLHVRTWKVPLRGSDGEVLGVLGIYADDTERRREADLRERDREFRALFERSPDAMWLLDEQNRFVLANRSAAEMLGYQRDADILELTPAEISPAFQPDGRASTEKAAEMIALARAQGVHRFEWWHKHRDGHALPFEITLSNLEIVGQPRIFCIGRDISARKEAERKLQQNRDFLGLIIAGASEGICVYEDIDVHPHLVFSVWNDRMTQITGYTMDEMNHVGWFDALFRDPGVLAEALERRKSLTRGREMREETWRVSTKSGEQRILALSTSPLATEVGRRAVIGMARDMTAEVAAEEALQRSEQKYRGLFDDSVAAIFVVHRDGRILDINQAGLDMLGYSREEMLQLTLADIDPDRSITRPAGRRVLAGEKLTNLEHHLRRRDGRIVTVLNNSRPVTDLSGAVSAVQSTMIDITEWRHAQEEQQRLREQLGATQRLESVGRLAGGVAHDFNNMLSVILGRTALAMEQVSPGHPLQRHLREVMDAAQRSADLTRQLLGFARRQMASPVEIDLNDKVAGLVQMLGRLIGEDIVLEFSPGQDLASLKIDPSQVDQVLANLCLNARDAIDGPGHIRIETCNAELDGAQFDDGREGPQPMVLLSVSDDGCGMAPEVLANIFEPFFTTKDVGKGNGLGLATVYGIVKQNGGHVDVTSQTGRGSTFRVYLPAFRSKSAPAPGSARADGRPGGSDTVLLVEDEPAVREITQLMLESFGYEVLIANDGPAALKLAESRDGAIHLLVTDVIMPSMSGGELARRLGERRPGLKVLFLSGYTADVIASGGVLQDGVHFLQKPFSSQALAEKVRQVLQAPATS